MRKSVDRILITHVGSLPRGEELGEFLIEREAGRVVDNDKIGDLIEKRVAYVLEKQREAGVDVANDGEQGRVGFQTYVPQRMSGFGGASKRPYGTSNVAWRRSKGHVGSNRMNRVRNLRPRRSSEARHSRMR